MRQWAMAQWNDIKGNVKYGILFALWWVITTISKMLLQQIPHIASWMVWTILLALSLAVFLWLAKSLGRVQSQNVPTQKPSQLAQQNTSPFPSLSALNPQLPKFDFDVQQWFRMAYYSPLTAEFESNFLGIAQKNQPDDREGLLARFIGVGLVAYMHDQTWAHIFKSQILMLMHLNRQGGIMPIADAKPYYDKAAIDCPLFYANYLFDAWIRYMQVDLLVIRHPTDMLEITHKGRDFLKYIAHWGQDANAKNC
jgi:hypothetical protein